MRAILLLYLFLLSSLYSSQQLNSEYAIFSTKPLQAEAVISKTKEYLRFFTFINQKKTSAFSSEPSLRTEKVLQLEQYHTKTQKRQHFTLNPFKNSHDLHAIVTVQDISLLAAIDKTNHLHLAYLNEKGRTFSEFNYRDYEYAKIYKLIKENDGTFFVLLGVSNASKKLSYFKRGLGKEDLQLLHLDANLRPLKLQHFGNTQKERYIGMIKDDFQTFKILTQKSAKEFLIYESSRQNDRITKVQSTLPVEDKLLAIAQDHLGAIYLSGQKKKIYKLTTKITSFDLNLTRDQHIQTLSQDQSNQWVISGTCHSKQGDSDGFISLLNSDFKTVWTKKFQTPFNDQTLHHMTIDNKIHYTGSSFDRSQKKRLFYLTLSKRGFTYKPKEALGIKDQFIKQLKLKIGSKYQRYLDVLSSSDIYLKSYFNPQSSTISSKVRKDLENFFKDFLFVISTKKYKKQIKKIYFNGFTSSEWHRVNEQKRYLNNAQLSQERAFSLLKTLIESTKDRKKRLWLEKTIVLRSYASSQTVQNTQNLENFEKSRRATLSIQWE
ncbi:MAG: OmpA family protein [Thiovulaceae bacterium]|nr:OmpA family protein [Sulfurimonadaceae bacterium]